MPPTSYQQTPAQIERNRLLQAGRNAKRTERERAKRAESERRARCRQPSSTAAAFIELYRAEKAARIDRMASVFDDARDALRRSIPVNHPRRAEQNERSVVSRPRGGE